MLQWITASVNRSTSLLIRVHHAPFLHRSPFSSISQSAHPVLSISQSVHNSAQQVPSVNAIKQSISQLVEATQVPAINQPVNQPSVKPNNYFPYGSASFEEIRENNQFFVDRTSFITQYEFMSKHCLLLRPPRFGKTLFLNQLVWYYDHLTNEEQFQKLFGHLKIVKDQSNWRNSSSFEPSASHPTPGCRTFHVLQLNLSIDTSGGINTITQKLHDHINGCITDFCVKYNLTGDVANRDLYSQNSFARLQDLARALVAQHRSGQLKQPPRLLVLVDEYDRYANKLILEDTDEYLASLEVKTAVHSLIHPLRSLLETLKSIDSITGLGSYRTLVVGITPVALADASGANIWQNISFHPAFSNLCGFTESDLQRGLSDVGFDGDKQLVPLKIMKNCFNGYKFPGCESSLYNPQLVLDFMAKLQSGVVQIDRLGEIVFMLDNNVDVHLYDEKLVDDNSTASPNVLALLSRSSALKIFTSLSAGISYTLCHSISAKSLIELEPSTLEPTNPQPTGLKRTHVDYLASFLYYYGWVTIKQQVLANRFVFGIPNLLTRPLFLDHLQDMVLRLEDVTQFIDNPTEERLARILAPLFFVVNDRQWSNHVSEDALVVVFTMLFAQVHGSSVIAEAKTTRVRPSGRASDGYIDIWLQSRTSNKAAIIEFKRVRPNALDIGELQHQFDWKSMHQTTNYTDLFAHLTSLRPDELRSLQYKPWQAFKQAKTWNQTKELFIQDVETDAIQQVSDYKPVSSSTVEVARFTVVQVGKPFLITKVDP